MDMNNYQRLQNAFEFSRDKLTPFRQRRLQSVRAYTGGNYGDGTNDRAHPVNLLEMAVNIYRRNLAARRPKVDITPIRRDLAITAKKAEMMLNAVLDEMDFEKSLSAAVMDSLFCIGILKVGLTTAKAKHLSGITHDAGLPFADAIDLDDFVMDMRARTMETVQFIGNRFIANRDMAMESGLYDFDGKEPAEAIQSPFNEYGDQKMETLSRSSSLVYDNGRMSPVIEMWEIYMPFEGRVVTFECDQQGIPNFSHAVRSVDWEGPEIGPYHLLSLGDVPGQVMPIAPANSLVDLSEAMNRTMRKLVRQNDRSKTVGVVAAGAEDDGERIIEANDGDMIRSDRPEATRELKFGGVDQGTLAFALQLRDLFNYTGGNLDTIGGLSSVANTLGQEELIKASSSQKIQDMQARVTSFTQDVVKSIGLWAWYDPARTYVLTEDLGDTGISVEIELKAKDRNESEFFDLNFSVQPGSLQETSASERASTMSAFMNQTLVPMAPMMQEQGLQIDIPAYVGHMADLTGVKEMSDLITPVGVAPDPNNVLGKANTSPPGEGKPPVTRREYIRRNVPTGGTRESRDNQMMQTLAGSNPRPGSESMNLPMQGPLG